MEIGFFKLAIVLSTACYGANAKRCTDVWKTRNSGVRFQLCQNSSTTHDCRSIKFNVIPERTSSRAGQCSPVHGELLRQYEAVAKQNSPDDFHLWTPLVGVFGFMAIFGNIGTIGISGTKLWCRKRSLSKVEKLHNILLLNLSLADFLMGVYLVTLFALGAAFGIPCRTPACYDWQTGNLCVVMGVLSYVSSEVSVCTLVTITTCRLYSVLRPFKTIHIRPVVAAAVLSWLVCLFVACVPLLDIDVIFDLFHVGMYVDDECPDRPFLGDYAHWHELLSQVLGVVNCSHRLPGHRSWTEVKSIAVDIGMFKPPDLRFVGYYQEMPTCSVNFITSRQEPVFAYLLQMVAVNLLAFAYIAVAYAIIVSKTRSLNWRRACHMQACRLFGRPPASANQREKENLAMHRRMFFLVLTDFACWVPMSLTVISRCLAAPSKRVEDDAVLYMAVVLIPLNSALNPLLYTAHLTNLWQRVVELFRKSGRRRDDGVDSGTSA